jgi:hypothetical protein
LSDKNVFIRIHHSSFENGLHQAFLGYFHCEHPRGADMTVWESKIKEAINDYWQDKEVWTAEAREKFLADNEVTFPLGGYTLEQSLPSHRPHRPSIRHPVAHQRSLGTQTHAHNGFYPSRAPPRKPNDVSQLVERPC